jgi:hypothetical protein
MTTHARITTAKGRKYYFAYGMNTNLGEMARRCPASVAIGSLILDDHRLVFRGVADIEPCVGRKVWGALWTITAECERALDLLEGYPNFYTKDEIDFEYEGTVCTAMVYVMRGRQYESPPGSGYEQCLREGYAAFDMPQKQIDRAIKEARKAEPKWKRRNTLLKAGVSPYHRQETRTDDYSWITADSFTPDDPEPRTIDDVIRDMLADEGGMPECERCATNETVVENGPEYAGSEFRCKQCGLQWVQET